LGTAARAHAANGRAAGVWPHTANQKIVGRNDETLRKSHRVSGFPPPPSFFRPTYRGAEANARRSDGTADSKPTTESASNITNPVRTLTYLTGHSEPVLGQ